MWSPMMFDRGGQDDNVLWARGSRALGLGRRCTPTLFPAIL